MRLRTGLCCVFACAAAALGQHSDNFETGYTVGIDLNGQNGYYNPVPASSISATVLNYAGNPFGFPQNPKGGDVFIGGNGPGGGIFVRSQKDVPYPAGKVRLSYDIASKFVGTAAATQNLGSFSTQTFPGSATFIALATWTNTATPTTWDADMIWFSSAGAQLQEKLPGMTGLAADHWYRRSFTFDLATNQITRVSVTDLTTGVHAVVRPTDRYLFGGAAGAPAPTGFRWFIGGGGPDNVHGYDNLKIVPAPGAAAILGLSGLLVTRRRR